jgi:predicted Zn-dependent protease
MSTSCSRGRPRARALVAIGLLGGLLGGCATPLSVGEERKLGAELDREVRRDSLLVRDEVILGYVERIGREIVAAAGPGAYEYRFRVVDDPEINAFAGPAGYVYVHTAILLKARNVSEVAGVLAHEIGHVALRHVAENYNRARNTGLLYQAGVVAAAVLAGSGAAQLEIV